MMDSRNTDDGGVMGDSAERDPAAAGAAGAGGSAAGAGGSSAVGGAGPGAGGSGAAGGAAPAGEDGGQGAGGSKGSFGGGPGMPAGRGKRRPLRKAEIARAMGWNKSYLSKERFRDMPHFWSLEDFRAWYSATGVRGQAVVSVARPTGTDGTHGRNQHAERGGGREFYDLSRWDVEPADFDEELVRRAEAVVSRAFGLHELAVQRGDIAAAFGSVKNFGEAAKQAAAAKERYLDMLERQRRLLPLDEVMDVVGGVLSELQGRLSRMGARIAMEANPGDPEKAQRVIDDETDRILESVEEANERVVAALQSDDGGGGE